MKDETTNKITDAARARKKAVRRSAPFFAALCLLTVVAWLLPLRPTVSELEKRPLKSFPAYDTKALLSGAYFRDIEDWFSDTFPFREDWIAGTKAFQKIYGVQTTAVYGKAPVTDAVPVMPTPRPTAEPGAETPAPTPTPAPTAAPTAAPEESAAPEAPAETPAPEAPPEEEWHGQEIEDDEYVGRSTILQIGDAAYVYPGFSEYCAGRYAELMNRAAELLDGRAKVYSIVIPESGSYMLKREDRDRFGFVPEEDALAYIYSLMDDRVGKVNIFDTLVAHNDEYLAFRSDSHWTARAAYYAYEEWCRVAEKTPVPLSEYEEIAYEGFLGSLYAGAGMSNLIADNPDTVFCYVPPGDVHLYINGNGSDFIGGEYPLINDRTYGPANSKYMAFLYGDHAKVTFINNDIDDDSACLVLKTSFGNPFVYYLTQHYHSVYVLDMRKYYTRNLTNFVDAFGVEDVIFIHASGPTTFESGIQMVGALIR